MCAYIISTSRQVVVRFPYICHGIAGDFALLLLLCVQSRSALVFTVFPETSKVEGPESEKSECRKTKCGIDVFGSKARAAVYTAPVVYWAFGNSAGAVRTLFFFDFFSSSLAFAKASFGRALLFCRVSLEYAAAREGGSGVSRTGNTSLTGNSRGCCCRRGKLLPYGPPRSTENATACLPAVVIRIARWHEPTAALLGARSRALSLFFVLSLI